MVLHNICNMDSHDLSNMYALALGPAALGLVHTYQANHSCPCYIYNISVHVQAHHFNTKMYCRVTCVTYVHDVRGYKNGQTE